MSTFSKNLLTWYHKHGRKDLPWQKNRTPYRVWISEIMLQQTQVKTVIPYYSRFMKHFPSITSLAAAKEDEVLHLWSGLGYYSRARNLHKAAKMIVDTFHGRFPKTLEEAMQLPGIGRSTAGAILAFCFEAPIAILDGNVKRVLTRYHAIEGFPSKPEIEKKLWEQAESHLPNQDIVAYTQAIMDLGAMICTRTQPSCAMCPVKASCKAFQSHQVTLFPTPKPKKKIPTREAHMLIIMNNDQHVLLEKRTKKGVWQGLWSFPEVTSSTKTDITKACKAHVGKTPQHIIALTPFQHVFSHYKLIIHPIIARCNLPAPQNMETDHCIWYNVHTPKRKGIAAPIQKILGALHDSHDTLSKAT